VNISVILCTYNRCALLAEALESVAAQTLPGSVEWEVLVVDNNSRDETRAVVDHFISRCPRRFRYLFEPQPGKSHALNSGIREAHGQILAFIDDDVTAQPAWLHNLTSGLHCGSFAGAGGRILPPANFSPPTWLSVNDRYWLGTLALFDLGSESGVLNDPPFGTNMAFRKEVFVRHGDFRTNLGPRPDSFVRGEDTEFGRRVLIAGERLRYEPSAVVFHPVPSERLKKSYFRSWWFDKGRTDLREFGLPPAVKWSAGGIPLYMFRRIMMASLRWLVATQPAKRFYRSTQVKWLAGQMMEARQLHRIEELTSS